MKKAKRISPTPIVEAIVELRFTSDTSSSAIALALGKKLGDTFPEIKELPILNLPVELRNSDRNLRYTPTHRLEGKNYSINIGGSVLSLNFTRTSDQDYIGWDDYRAKLEEVLEVFNENFKIDIFERIGVRYINSFKVTDFPGALRVKLELPFDDKRVDLSENSTLGFIVDSEKQIKCRVQINGGATLRKPEGTEKAAILDIDCFTEEIVAGEDALTVIDKAHTLEEEVFFELIDDKYAEDNFEKIES